MFIVHCHIIKSETDEDKKVGSQNQTSSLTRTIRTYTYVFPFRSSYPTKFMLWRTHQNAIGMVAFHINQDFVRQDTRAHTHTTQHNAPIHTCSSFDVY